MAFLSYSRLINNSLSFATFGLFSCNRYSKKLINQTTRKTKIANSCSLFNINLGIVEYLKFEPFSIQIDIELYRNYIKKKNVNSIMLWCSLVHNSLNSSELDVNFITRNFCSYYSSLFILDDLKETLIALDEFNEKMNKILVLD